MSAKHPRLRLSAPVKLANIPYVGERVTYRTHIVHKSKEDGCSPHTWTQRYVTEGKVVDVFPDQKLTRVCEYATSRLSLQKFKDLEHIYSYGEWILYKKKYLARFIRYDTHERKNLIICITTGCAETICTRYDVVPITAKEIKRIEKAPIGNIRFKHGCRRAVPIVCDSCKYKDTGVITIHRQ